MGRRWAALRVAILRRDRHTCRACGAHGLLEIDHVEPVSRAPELRFDPANLQALCRACHVAKTNAELGRAPVSEARQAWREAVANLSRPGGNRARKEPQCSNP